MRNIIKSFLASFYLLILLSACSSTLLQTRRLDEAEDYIFQAEQALAASRVNDADEKLGTANSYLATLIDNKKYLNENEWKRYQVLKQRSDDLLKRIRE